MEKKYFTNPSMLMSILLLLLLTIIMAILPFFYEEEVMKVIWLVVPMAIGFGYWFVKSFCYYPVFSDDALLLKNALLASLNKEFKYSDIHFATVSKVDGRNGEILKFSLASHAGENVELSLMTAVRQLDELKSELLSHNVSDRPIENMKRKSETVIYKGKGAVMFGIMGVCVLGISFIVCLAPSVMTSYFEDIVDVVMVYSLASVFAITGVGPLMMANYVTMDGTCIEIKNPYLPFMKVRCFYSDIEDVSFNESSGLLKIVRKDSVAYGKRKVCRRIVLCDGNLFYTHLKSCLGSTMNLENNQSE